MLTPQQILEIIDTLYPHIDELNEWITKDIIKRVMARLARRNSGLYMTATDDWQLQVYQAAGGHLEAVQAEIVKWTKKTDAEIKRIFEDAGIKTLVYDSDFYVSHGLDALHLAQSESMIRLLEDTYQRTAGTVHNFTRTTAQASQQRLINALDTAHFKVANGAASYTQAVQEAVESIVSEQTHVRYPSGHVDTIETAVLRAVRTGVAQASGNMAIEGMIERDWDIVLVSAHLGARYGDGGENPSNHFWWQGKFYSRTGRTPDLPLFAESTGYGTGEGLCGWNCRHSFGPGDLRHNPYKSYDAEENKKAYDLSQSQRAKENRIRHTKMKLVGLREAIDSTEDPSVKAALENEYMKTSKLLEKQNLDYNAFCQNNGLKRLADRIQIAKWDRKQAVAAEKAVQAETLKIERNRGIIKQRVADGEYSLTLSKQQHLKHVEGTAKYSEYLESRRAKGKSPQSIITVSEEEAQEILTKFHGTGIPREKKNGGVADVEFVTVDRFVGKYLDRNGLWKQTTRAALHYGKRGSHVVPVEDKDG